MVAMARTFPQNIYAYTSIHHEPIGKSGISMQPPHQSLIKRSLCMRNHRNPAVRAPARKAT
jgi:hypothetical protein